MTAHLRLISAPPPDTFLMLAQNVRLLANEVMAAAGDMLVLRDAHKNRDLDRMADANDMLGIHLRAAERLRLEIQKVIEAQQARQELPTGE